MKSLFNLRLLLLATLSCLAGFSWGHESAPWAIVATILFPLAWHRSPHRIAGFFCAIAYYIAASRGLAEGANVFFGSQQPVWYSYALWSFSIVLNALPWLVFWSPDADKRIRLAVLNLLLGILPPFSFTGWTHPIIAAGWWFPGLGFLSPLLWILVLWCIAGQHRRCMAGIMAAALACNLMFQTPPPPAHWKAINTRFGGLDMEAIGHNSVTNRLIAINMAAQLARPGERIVMPESTIDLIPEWAEASLEATSEQLRRKNARLLFGTSITSPEPRMLNRLRVLGEPGGHQDLFQRLPMPGTMWTFFNEHNNPANYFSTGIHRIGNERIALFICFEQLPVLPMLQSMLAGPDIIVAASNMWWAVKTPNLYLTERQSLEAWSRAFQTPFVMALNL